MSTKYQKRNSGPLLDRIDMHIDVPRVDYNKLSSDRLGESSAAIQKRVEAAREIQRKRFGASGDRATSGDAARQRVTCNADMRVGEIRQFCKLEEAGESLLRAAMSQMNLSARAYHRSLKLGRTIADLGGSDGIQPAHLPEALQYGPKLIIG